MKIMKIIGIAAVAIIIIMLAEILGHTTAYARITEEYIAVFTENRDDFEYVSQVMKQGEELSYIVFDYRDSNMDFEDCVSSNNPELESEISSNKKFYESLKNIYELNEIRNICVISNSIVFNFRREPRGQSADIVYGEEIKKSSYSHIIEKNWALEMKPVYDHSH